MVFHYYHYIELLSFVLSVVLFSALKEKRLEGYALFLGITIITEVTASNWLNWTGNIRNDIIYNIYWTLSNPVQLYIFYRVLSPLKKSLNAFKIFCFIVIALSLINLLFIQGIFLANTYTFILFGLINIFFSVMILFQLVTNENININFLKSPYFWVFGALLLFSLGALIIIGLRQFIILYDLTINGKHIYKVLMPILIVILYSSYSYGFYLCKKQTRK